MYRSAEGLKAVTGEWECMECGYVEEGVQGRRPRKCPDCDAPAAALEFFPDEDDADLDGVRGYDEEEDLDEYEEEEFEDKEREWDFP